MKKEVKMGILGLLLVIPSFLVLLAVVILPICLSFIESLKNKSGGFDLSNYGELFSDKVMSSNIIFTLKVTIISVIWVLLISYALAVFMRFSNGVMVEWIRKVYMIPIFIPSVIATYGLINLLGDHGWLARIMLVLHLGHLPRIIFDIKGII